MDEEAIRKAYDKSGEAEREHGRTFEEYKKFYLENVTMYGEYPLEAFNEYLEISNAEVDADEEYAKIRRIKIQRVIKNFEALGYKVSLKHNDGMKPGKQVITGDYLVISYVAKDSTDHHLAIGVDIIRQIMNKHNMEIRRGHIYNDIYTKYYADDTPYKYRKLRFMV